MRWHKNWCTTLWLAQEREWWQSGDERTAGGWNADQLLSRRNLWYICHSLKGDTQRSMTCGWDTPGPRVHAVDGRPVRRSTIGTFLPLRTASSGATLRQNLCDLQHLHLGPEPGNGSRLMVYPPYPPLTKEGVPSCGLSSSGLCRWGQIRGSPVSRVRDIDAEL